MPPRVARSSTVKSEDGGLDAAAAAVQAEAEAAVERARLTDKVAKAKVEDEKREERFVTLLQSAMELDLEDCRLYDLKERNALYANCVKLLAILTKIKGDDDDGSFFGED